MALCETESNMLPGPCQSEARWLGPDGRKRCSLHQIQEFGHAEPLVKVPDYEPPRQPEPEPKAKAKPKPRNGRRRKKGARSG
jgi:hypothetical protein